MGYSATAVTIGLTGAFPAMTNYVRIYNVTGAAALVTGTIAAGESGTRTTSVNIPVNATWAGRSVRTEYYHPGTGAWITIGSAYTQPGYVTTGLSRSGTASSSAFNITVTSTGYQPALPLRVITGSTVLASGVNLAAGYSSRSTTITCPANTDTAASREVYVQAQFNGTWTNIGAAFTQPRRGVVLSTGRVVALNDVGTMSWAEAMGISTTYNSTLFNNPSNYTPTTTTGCGGYSETGYPAGTWRLPTQAELSEIYTQRTAIGNLVSSTYWSTSEWSTNVSFAYYVRMSDGVVSYSTKGNSINVRCVRAQ